MISHYLHKPYHHSRILSYRRYYSRMDQLRSNFRSLLGSSSSSSSNNNNQQQQPQDESTSNKRPSSSSFLAASETAASASLKMTSLITSNVNDMVAAATQKSRQMRERIRITLGVGGGSSSQLDTVYMATTSSNDETGSITANVESNDDFVIRKVEQQQLKRRPQTISSSDDTDTPSPSPSSKQQTTASMGCGAPLRTKFLRSHRKHRDQHRRSVPNMSSMANAYDEPITKKFFLTGGAGSGGKAATSSSGASSPTSPTGGGGGMGGGDNVSEHLFNYLRQDLAELVKHFEQDTSGSSGGSASAQAPPTITTNEQEHNKITAEHFLKVSRHALHTLEKCIDHYHTILDNASAYDYKNGDVTIPANGYRSIARMFESCCRHMLQVTHTINEKKSNLFFTLRLNYSSMISSSSAGNSTGFKDLQTWQRLLERIEQLLKLSLELQGLSKTNGTLFVHAPVISDTFENNLFQLGSPNYSQVYFGRATGFQFCPSLQMPLTACTVALASYNDGYEVMNYFMNINSGPTNCGPGGSQVTPASSSKLSSPSSADAAPPPSSSSFYSFFNRQAQPQNKSMSATTSTENLAAAATAASPSSTEKDVKSTSSNYSSSLTPLPITTAIGQAAKSLINSTRYLIDPEFRAKKMAHVLKNASVEFCKAFWQLTESSIVTAGSNLIAPTLNVNIVKTLLANEPLTIANARGDGGQVTVNPPVMVNAAAQTTSANIIQIRVLSTDFRDGMEGLERLATTEGAISTPSSSADVLPKSRHLMLHAHGGGFIAHSSKSHQIYLRPWCKELKVPIVSIDYSLAPECAFPRASEECFYVYVWCLLNRDALGWTGERIVVVGDSAGGVLVTNIVQRAIAAGVRVPDALVPIYTPFLLSYSLSPSRIMSVMDPLLNLGILWRCLAAYSGVDFKAEFEKYARENKIELEHVWQQPAAASQSPSATATATTTGGEFEAKAVVDTPPEDNKSTSSNLISTSSSLTSFRDEAAYDDGRRRKSTTPSSTNSSSSGVVKSSSSPYFNNKGASGASCDAQHPPPVIGAYATDDLEHRQKRIQKLHKLVGDSVFLIECLRNHPLTQNPYMSPMLTDDDILRQFPKTFLIACDDPFLDDNVEMALRLQQVNVNHELVVVQNGVPHGFLNMLMLSDETAEAHGEALCVLQHVFDELAEADKAT